MRVRRRRPTVHVARMVSELLRTVPCCAPIALAAPVALAQPDSSATLMVAIPAQPLAQALSAFATQTGLQMVYVSGLIRNQQSHAVAAEVPVQEALTQLLQGTGLRFEYLTAHSVRILATAPAPKFTQTAGDEELSDIIVTANRREQRLQDVPITIDVLTEATLAHLNATTFDDFLGYLPGVTAHGVGPSQNNLYMRGLGVGDAGLQATGFSGPFPQVAIYLDEQSAQLPGRNLDLYTTDLERVEVLEGPQGTVFGASAEAGVLRYITHRPELDVTEATVSTGLATTAHGAGSYSASLVVNLPLIPGQLAVRGVLYDERRGGYIDNVPGTFQHTSSDLSANYNGFTVSPDSVVINNAPLVTNDINPVTYRGVRFEALYKFSDDWDALIAESYQRLEADGVAVEQTTDVLGKPLPELSVQLFNPSYDKDWFENTALTVHGQLGLLKLLYAGSYLTRHVEQVQDYTDYARGGVYIDYYQCIPETKTSSTLHCFSPSSTWRALESNTHLSQELRLTTPDEWRLRALGGLFFEKYTVYDQSDWFYLTSQNYFYPLSPVTGYWALNGSPYKPDGEVVTEDDQGIGAKFVPGAPTLNNPNTRPPGDGFFNDMTRGYDQKAVYASVDYDLVPHTLTLTAGTRYYGIHTFQVGAVGISYGCMISNNPPNPCNDYGLDLNALGLNRTDGGFRSRANLSWKVTDDVLLYYTWSQGFRAGGYNRGFTPTYLSPLSNSGEPNQTQAYLHGGYVPPVGYAPDTLTNNEIGWKTSWLGDRVRWNGALYQEQWDHAQFGALDNSVTGISTFNGGDYRLRGIETSGTVQVLDGFTLDFGVAWNRSELVREAQFFWVDGTPINWSLLQTYSGEKLFNPAGTLGSPLAGAPTIRGNLRLRYERMLGDFAAFTQLGIVYQSSSLASTDRLSLDAQGNSAAYELPAFTTLDGAVGFSKNAWQVQLYGQNLTDTHAQLFENSSQFYTAITVNRPRTVGLHFSYRFRSDPRS
jgi:iron complex outermembrane receptor protein